MLPQISLVWLAYRAGSILAATWIAVVAFVTLSQRSMLYFPDSQRVTPEEAGLAGVTQDTIVTPDGERLVIWWSPPQAGKPVLLYFHGNGGNIAVRAPRVKLFQSAGYGALMVDYRGYGGSTGSPSERAIIADAKLVYDWLRDKGVEAGKIVLFGESLGTGVAVQVAAVRAVAGLILDSPYTSLADVAQRRLPYLPVRLLMWDAYDSLARIKDIHVPLLVIHGDQDRTVPFDLGQRLFEAAVEPKQMLVLPGRGHVVPLSQGGWSAIVPFIEGLR